jgi:hypothetical protein
MKNLILLVTVALTALHTAQGALLTGPIANPGNGHTYYLLTEDTWQSSEAQAVSLGGHLATINDQAEQDLVFSSFGSFSGVSRSLWIGLTDQASEGNFTWISGEPVLYTHWIALQPDNAFGNENYVHMVNSANEFGHSGGLWNDLASPNTIFATFNPLNGVVEVVPEPASAALTLAGLMGLLGFRWQAKRAVGSERSSH